MVAEVKNEPLIKVFD